MNCKVCGIERSWFNFKVGLRSQNSPEGIKKNTENLSQDSRSLRRDLKPGHPEYERGVLTTRPKRSVAICGEEMP